MPNHAINKYTESDGCWSQPIAPVSASVLLLPGLYYSMEDHWISRWKLAYGYKCLEHDESLQPLRGDWLVRLEDAISDEVQPVIAVAHGLGCLQLAAWAMHSKNTQKISAALLVEPTDATLPALQSRLWSWQAVARQPLPMRGVLVGCVDDFSSRLDFSQSLAKDWGTQWVDGAQCGYSAITAKGNWQEGQELLRNLTLNLMAS